MAYKACGWQCRICINTQRKTVNWTRRSLHWHAASVSQRIRKDHSFGASGINVGHKKRKKRNYKIYSYSIVAAVKMTLYALLNLQDHNMTIEQCIVPLKAEYISYPRFTPLLILVFCRILLLPYNKLAFCSVLMSRFHDIHRIWNINIAYKFN